MKIIKTFFLLCLTSGLFLLFTSHVLAAKTNMLTFTTQDFSPFSYLKNDIVSGPAVDIIKTVCQEIQMKCSFKLYPWPRAQALVKDGTANGMFVIGWNEKRSKWLYFSPPILDTEYGFFVQNDNPLEFNKVTDIDHYRVGVFGPSNTATSLKKIKIQVPGINIDQTPDDIACFRKLSRGRVQAVYSNKDVGFSLIKKLGLQNIRYAGSQKKLSYYIGFSILYNDKATIDQFNAAFMTLHKKGQIKKILKNYNMEPSKIK